MARKSHDIEPPVVGCLFNPGPITADGKKTWLVQPIFGAETTCCGATRRDPPLWDDQHGHLTGPSWRAPRFLREVNLDAGKLGK